MKRSLSISLKELASITNTELVGNPEHCITGVEDIEQATTTDAAFLDHAAFASMAYSSRMKHSNAGVIILKKGVDRINDKNYLLSEHPSLTFQTILELFIELPVSEFQTGIHPSVVRASGVEIGDHVVIGPYVVLDRDVRIGEGVRIEGHCYIGAGVTIGAYSHIHPHVTIQEGCILGDRVVIGAGSVIGSSGFGYFTTAQGEHRPLKQLGSVIIEEDVEIGSNTSVDRGRFGVTRIGKGTKIDNLVQIGHRVSLGAHNLIVAQTGIAGSTKTGRRVIMGGQVGVIGHITLGDDVILAARAAPIKSLSKGVYTGAPATPLREYNEQMVYVRNLKSWISRIQQLEAEVERLQSKMTNDVRGS